MSTPSILPRLPLRSARPRPAGVRPRVTVVDGYQFHALEHGQGDPLVLIHGLSGSSRWWERNVAGLAEHHRVLIPDLIGFGSSPRPRGRLPALDRIADLLARWMDGLGLERTHLVGHSMGGQIAIHLAARHPERLRRLVLVDAAGIPRPITPKSVLQFATEIAPLWRWGDPRFLPVMVGDAWTAGPLTIAQAIRHILRDDVRPLLSGIEAPTLVVWGERDSWVPLSHGWEMRQQIPRARLAVLRGASHNSMVDRPADFNRLVLRFLDGEEVGR
jgi:pimeloyl-ACP methyl ester carboxylesterase